MQRTALEKEQEIESKSDYRYQVAASEYPHIYSVTFSNTEPRQIRSVSVPETNLEVLQPVEPAEAWLARLKDQPERWRSRLQSLSSIEEPGSDDGDVVENAYVESVPKPGYLQAAAAEYANIGSGTKYLQAHDKAGKWSFRSVDEDEFYEKWELVKDLVRAGKLGYAKAGFDHAFDDAKRSLTIDLYIPDRENTQEIIALYDELVRIGLKKPHEIIGFIEHSSSSDHYLHVSTNIPQLRKTLKTNQATVQTHESSTTEQSKPVSAPTFIERHPRAMGGIFGGVLGGGCFGLLAGMVLGSFIPGVGTVIGGVIGFFAGLIVFGLQGLVVGAIADKCTPIDMDDTHEDLHVGAGSSSRIRAELGVGNDNSQQSDLDNVVELSANSANKEISNPQNNWLVHVVHEVDHPDQTNAALIVAGMEDGRNVSRRYELVANFDASRVAITDGDLDELKDRRYFSSSYSVTAEAAKSLHESAMQTNKKLQVNKDRQDKGRYGIANLEVLFMRTEKRSLWDEFNYNSSDATTQDRTPLTSFDWVKSIMQEGFNQKNFPANIETFKASSAEFKPRMRCCATM